MAGFDHSFGMEEEFFLVDAETGALGTPALDQLMQDAKAKLGDIVTSELLQSQIEIASPILHSHAEACEVMSRTRRTLSEVVASHGLQIVAASTHPLGIWQEQLITETRRYDKLISDFRIVSQRNLVCGLHIHVALPESVDRVDVMNRAMHWLPVFLSTHTRRLIDENRWRAKRDGVKAEFILETSNEVVPAATMVRDLMNICAEQIERLECAEAFKPLERILSEGTSAHQQLKIYNDSRAAGDENPQALLKVIEWLKATTLVEVASN